MHDSLEVLCTKCLQIFYLADQRLWTYVYFDCKFQLLPKAKMSNYKILPFDSVIKIIFVYRQLILDN